MPVGRCDVVMLTESRLAVQFTNRLVFYVIPELDSQDAIIRDGHGIPSPVFTFNGERYEEKSKAKE